MEEKRIEFETAKLAKEKGFPQHECPSYLLVDFAECNVFGVNPGNLRKGDEIGYYIPDKTINRPTQSLLQKWLREVHGIDFIIKPFYDSKMHKKTYVADAVTPGSPIGKIVRQDSYETALEIGLQEALKLIKQKEYEN